jgi:pullulanase/glycogen debranching enzyme
LNSFKGVDNGGYDSLGPDDPRYYTDFTGTSNTLNTVNPAVLRLIMYSLRYFVLECHVDGFRFDLAATLARELYDVDRLGSFFDVIHQDPFLSQVKLIAEPWDLGGPLVTRWATSRRCERSGTGSVATAAATSGAGKLRFRSPLNGSLTPPSATTAMAASRSRRPTS